MKAGAIDTALRLAAAVIVVTLTGLHRRTCRAALPHKCGPATERWNIQTASANSRSG